MEIHSVLPEERARTEKGETLPWGYRYADSAKNTRQPEESGPFGRNRSIRYTSSIGRRASTRQGTTPSRQKENSAVSDFSRLFAKEQASRTDSSLPASGAEGPEALPLERVPTECLLYGYPSKASEWKVISRYERIVSPSIICEDYPREDPNLYLSSNSPIGFNRSSIVVHRNLSKDALAKSRIYSGGSHWIKVTFDSWEAAERACFYSPVEIDGCLVHCEMWAGKGPLTDAPIPKSADPAAGQLLSAQRNRTIGPATGKASAIAGFEQALSGTLPRNHTMPGSQYRQPASTSAARDDLDVASSTTASSATATSPKPPPQSNLPAQASGTSAALTIQTNNGSALRSRSVPNLPSQAMTTPSSSQFMSHAPQIRRATLRPITEALPPQQSLVERVLRSIPVVSWVLGLTAPAASKKDEKQKGAAAGGQGLIGEGPIVKEDGSWDEAANGWYWGFWWRVDRVLGSDFCGLKED